MLFYLEVTDFDEAEDTDPTNKEELDDQPPLTSLHAIAGLTTTP